ncbi:hypothetical protein RD1_3604 [Roseobacter denitrificans OCh 114]|uniref:Uncharacterized protein n=1 Tax=Roseobacter denitrificans (strain ATCC 33942 / OCh 114) TaxID=375451 RepID=Q162L1_ROSDO|nr:hypothetical protein RD1_3604 [Roseobacter denitrificans OCh 114]
MRRSQMVIPYPDWSLFHSLEHGSAKTILLGSARVQTGSAIIRFAQHNPLPTDTSTKASCEKP